MATLEKDSESEPADSVDVVCVQLETNIVISEGHLNEETIQKGEVDKDTVQTYAILLNSKNVGSGRLRWWHPFEWTEKTCKSRIAGVNKKNVSEMEGKTNFQNFRLFSKS